MSITAMTDNSNDHAALVAMETRLRLLEDATLTQKHEITTLKEKNKILATDFDKFQERIRSGWAKVIWMMGGSIMAAFMTWVMKGGLNNVTN